MNRCAHGVTFPVKNVNANVFYVRKAKTLDGVSVHREPGIFGRPAVFTTVRIGNCRCNAHVLRKPIPR